MTKEKKDLLVFGYGLTLILSFFGWHNVVKHDWTAINMGLFVLAGIILCVTIFNRKILKKIYDRWMFVAHRIGTVITIIILCLVYYGVFMPTGFFMRLTGRDLLDIHIDKKKTSYWVKRERKPFLQKDYQRQF